VHYTGNDLLVWYFMISELLCMTWLAVPGKWGLQTHASGSQIAYM
jgi:hypothetical protein